MMVQRYGVLKGSVIRSIESRGNNRPHYKIYVKGEEDVEYEVAVNVKSSSNQSKLLYLADGNFNAEEITNLPGMDNGYTEISTSNQNIALDYVRGGLFDPSQMVSLSHNETGPDNDLNDFLHKHIQEARSDQTARIYIYGSKYDTGVGMHNVHMNQGNKIGGQWEDDNGTWQDGGILIQFEDHWVAIFLAFLSQSWCTDDGGHPIEMCTHEEVHRKEH
ncbi:YukJ family protein [Bacillus wiedmannii]|uniref:YukJ family protein n=1 Tax=Bacillus wiedmannii TaxID=1890302 RepID=UPI0025A03B08|nr:YukJ family protein [Bacillus wiedmannii]MDM5264967.1 YukJ family protein [Bacillus wiedmannii]